MGLGIVRLPPPQLYWHWAGWQRWEAEGFSVERNTVNLFLRCCVHLPLVCFLHSAPLEMNTSKHLTQVSTSATMTRFSTKKVRLPVAVALWVIAPGNACTRDWLLRRVLNLADDVFRNCGVHSQKLLIHCWCGSAQSHLHIPWVRVSTRAVMTLRTHIVPESMPSLQLSGRAY